MFLSCTESGVGSSTGNNFQLDISVVDPHDHPVPGLRISGGNLLSIELQGKGIRGWSPSVFKAKLLIVDTLRTRRLFEDLVYMVYGDVDRSAPAAILGYTSAAGSLRITDPTRFPGLFTLPEIPETAEDPTTIGTFYVTDTARFFLHDSAGGGIPLGYDLDTSPGSSLFFGVKAFGGHAANWYELKPVDLLSGQMIARIFLS